MGGVRPSVHWVRSRYRELANAGTLAHAPSASRWLGLLAKAAHAWQECHFLLQGQLGRRVRERSVPGTRWRIMTHCGVPSSTLRMIRSTVPNLSGCVRSPKSVSDRFSHGQISFGMKRQSRNHPMFGLAGARLQFPVHTSHQPGATWHKRCSEPTWAAVVSRTTGPSLESLHSVREEIEHPFLGWLGHHRPSPS